MNEPEKRKAARLTWGLVLVLGLLLVLVVVLALYTGHVNSPGKHSRDYDQNAQPSGFWFTLAYCFVLTAFGMSFVFKKRK